MPRPKLLLMNMVFAFRHTRGQLQYLRWQAHCADAPYVTVKGPVTTWAFTLAYAPMEDFMPLAQEQLAASRLPYPDRDEMLQVQLQPSCGF